MPIHGPPWTPHIGVFYRPSTRTVQEVYWWPLWSFINVWVCSPRFHPLCPKLPSFNQIHLQDLSCFSWILGHPSQHQTWPVHICFLQTYWCPLIPVFPLISSPFHTFLHLRRLCSDKEDFLLQCSRMSEFLTARGYPPHQSLKTNWDAQNRSPGPVPLIWLHRLQRQTHHLCALASTQPPSLPDSLVKLAHPSKQHYSWPDLLW